MAENKNKRFDAALLETPLDQGLTVDESVELFEKLRGASAIPIEIQGESSVAMGWLDLSSAELMDYDHSMLDDFVKDILDDMERETPSGEYTCSIKNVEYDILIVR